MIFDVIAAVILVIFIIIGDRKGFVMSFISTFGGIMSLCAAYAGRDPFLSYLDENTTIRADVTAKLTERIQNRLTMQAAGVTSGGETIPGGIANLLQNAAAKAVESVAEKAAENVVDMIMPALAFVILLVIVRLLFLLIEQIIKVIAAKNGPIGAVNSIGGMVFSLVRGLITIYILAVVICAVAVIGNVDLFVSIAENSIICQALDFVGILPIAPDVTETVIEATI